MLCRGGETGCPEECWSHCPWRFSRRDSRGTEGHDLAGMVVLGWCLDLDDLRGRF